MKDLIAVGSFKGSLDSLGAGEAAPAGVLAADRQHIVVIELSDGGQGTLAALRSPEPLIVHRQRTCVH